MCSSDLLASGLNPQLLPSTNPGGFLNTATAGVAVLNVAPGAWWELYTTDPAISPSSALAERAASGPRSSWEASRLNCRSRRRLRSKGATARDCRARWEEQLAQAIHLAPPHLSVYDLTIEPGTVFARRLQQGRLALPDDDLGADLMDITAQRLGSAGYGRYEISNYAWPGHASRHNRVYWSGAGWWGFRSEEHTV